MRLPTLPKLNLPPEGRELIQIARLFAKIGIIEPFTVPMHNWPGPSAGLYRPEASGESTTAIEPWLVLEHLERLQRIQAIIDRGIQKRIREAEADQDSLQEPDSVMEIQVLRNYFAAITIPPRPISIGCTTLTNPAKAIQYHLAGLKAAPPGSLAAKADINNLRELKTALEAAKCVLN